MKNLIIHGGKVNIRRIRNTVFYTTVANCACCDKEVAIEGWLDSDANPTI